MTRNMTRNKKSLENQDFSSAEKGTWTIKSVLSGNLVFIANADIYGVFRIFYKKNNSLIIDDFMPF